MKSRIILVLLCLGISAQLSLVSAQSSPAPEGGTPTPYSGAKVKQIEDLKERLATKVAELRSFQRKAIAGKVKSQTVSSMTIETNTKEIKIELNDSIHVIQYLKGKRTKLTIDDVDNGDVVVVFGQYDTTIDILKTNLIVINNTEPQIRISGTVLNLDEEEFTMTVDAKDGIQYVVDIEKTTKTTALSDGSLVKSGFSKVVVGNTVHVIGSAVPKKEKSLSADRIIDLGKKLPFKQEPSPIQEEKSEASPTPAPKSSPKLTPTIVSQ